MSRMSPEPSWDPLDDLSRDQRSLLSEFENLIARVNDRVNLVSKSSLKAFETIHVRHSLALAHREFPPGATVVDWGTGGGLPGIPLAIRFPATRFVLVDSIGKKADLVRAVASKLGLKNVEVNQARAAEWTGTCDFAVSRATASLADLWRWTSRVLRTPPIKAESRESATSAWAPGLLALKGGDLETEIEDLQRLDPEATVSVILLQDLMGDPFEHKYVIQVTS